MKAAAKLPPMVGRIYLFNFFYMSLVIIPVVIPFFLSFDLTMEEIFKVQATFGMAMLLFEVPSSYMADLWGRKKTLLLGGFLTGVGFTYLLFANTYQELLIYEIILGVGSSLVSGTDTALLYDTVKGAGIKDQKIFRKCLGNQQFAESLGESVASILGGVLVLWSFHAVVWAQMVVGWIPFVVVLFLREPEYQKMLVHENLQNIKKIFLHLFASSRFVTLVFLNSVLWGLGTFVAVWIFQKYWQDNQIELVYFGVLWAGYNLTVGIASKSVHWLEHHVGVIALLIMAGILLILGYAGMAWTSGWCGVAAGFLFQISRGIRGVILSDALNWLTPSEFRATVNSIISLTMRLMFFLVGPLVGYGIDTLGLRQTLLYLAISCVVLFIVLLVPLIFAFARKHVAEIPSS